VRAFLFLFAQQKLTKNFSKHLMFTASPCAVLTAEKIIHRHAEEFLTTPTKERLQRQDEEGLLSRRRSHQQTSPTNGLNSHRAFFCFYLIIRFSFYFCKLCFAKDFWKLKVKR